MTTESLTAGDTVYLENGTICEFVAAHNGQFIVSPEMSRGEDEEPFFGRPITVSRVFTSPPAEVVEKRIAELLATETTIREKLNQAKEEERQLDKNAKERAARFKQHKALERIDDFIQGKITHYVIKYEHGGRIKITTPEDEKCGDEKYARDLKLLALFGKSDGNLEWKLSRYSDGSSYHNYYDVSLCQSHEEAMTIATAMIEATYASYREKPAPSHYIEGTVESARALFLPVPEDILAMMKSEGIANCKEEIRKIQKSLAEYQAKLAALKGNQP